MLLTLNLKFMFTLAGAVLPVLQIKGIWVLGKPNFFFSNSSRGWQRAPSSVGLLSPAAPHRSALCSNNHGPSEVTDRLPASACTGVHFYMDSLIQQRRLSPTPAQGSLQGWVQNNSQLYRVPGSVTHPSLTPEQGLGVR